MKNTFDYRDSHLGRDKGESYKKSFSVNPYKNMVWRYERSVLDQVIMQYFLDDTIYHLDFACGTGRILEYLEKRKATSSVGVDISPSMLEVARQCTSRSEIIEGDITRKDILGDRKFDLITAFRFFPNAHAELRSEALSTLVSYLNVGGYLVFNNHKNLTFPANRFKRLFGRGFNRGMTSREANALTESVGLTIEKVFHFGVIPSTNQHILLPSRLLSRLEGFFSGIESFKELALNQIYVCRQLKRS